MKYKSFDDVEGFIRTIPRTPVENIDFRIKLHSLLAKDKSAQKVFWSMCKEDLQVIFDTCFWTLNPRKPWGQQNQPFILRPQQIPAVHKINQNIIDSQSSFEPKDVGINKTRDEGASEIVAKIFSAWVMLYERVSFILGSDKKEDVDNQGNDFTLFAKVDNVFEHLPRWMGFKLETDGGCVKRKDMLLRVKENNSAIIGETTNENFSAGSRATAMVLDEFGRIRKGVADSIEGTVHAVTNCVIYSSTHWLGQNHTFNICLNKETTDVVELLWHQNPEKAEGLYRSPKPGVIEIIDIDYYRKKCPPVFNDIKPNTPIIVDELSVPMLDKVDVKFIADGNKDKIIIFRSPWHDYKEAQSKGNKRDFYCNTWATPLGSADTVFDHSVLYDIRDNLVRKPDYQGEITFKYTATDNIKDCLFVPELGQSRLKWWGPLINGRPDQRHNFVVGCDIGQGMGSSNSTALIYDVNTHELCGEWVCSHTQPEQFADQAVAITLWVGGCEEALLIWERNGGQGTLFTDRVAHIEYWNCYKQTVEDTISRQKKDKFGFISNTDRKAAILLELGAALSYALDNNKKYVCAYCYNEELLNELFDYIFMGEGREIGTSSKADLSSGARQRHGDRAIAAALCILGTRDQLKGEYYEQKHAPYGSFEYYRQEEERKRALDDRENKKYLFD